MQVQPPNGHNSLNLECLKRIDKFNICYNQENKSYIKLVKLKY